MARKESLEYKMMNKIWQEKGMLVIMDQIHRSQSRCVCILVWMQQTLDIMD